MLFQENFDVMCVSESWLSENISSLVVSVPGYKCIRKDRGSRGGGLLVYVKEGISAKTVCHHLPDKDTHEQLFVELTFASVKILICVLYRPEGSIINFRENIDDLLLNVTVQYNHVLLLGDINIDHLAATNPIVDTFAAYDFIQLITQPTRITQTSQKTIDVIYCNCPQFLTSSGVLNTDLISDHSLIFCNLNVYCDKSKPKFITYRDYKNFNLDQFLNDLNGIRWNDIFLINNINNKIKFLSDNIVDLFDKHAPLRTSRISKAYSPWLTSVVKHLMKLRDKALQKFKRTRSIVDWEYYKSLRNLTLSSIRREKKSFINNLIANNEHRTLWKTFRKFNIVQNKNKSIPCTLTSPTEINKNFLSVYTPPGAQPESCEYYKTHMLNEELNFGFTLTTIDDVHAIIDSLKSNAFGYDAINAKMLKLCSSVICPHITHIVNCCLEAGYFPDIWKIAIVTPLAKITDPKRYEDLRPISILPTLSKILEKVVYKQVYSYIDTSKIIPPIQSGFRAGYSTTTAMLNLIDNVIRDRDLGLYTVLVSLDYSKAFDKIDHDLLCAKLDHIGFDNISLNFFQSYLRNRYQMVSCNNEFSDLGLITSGVPQGSILGPLMFIIYIFDINSIIQHSNIQNYADDTQLYQSFQPCDIAILNQKINVDLQSIYDYSLQHNLKLNSDKCNFIVFGGNKFKETIKNDIKITIKQTQLKQCDHIKILGFTLDENIRFRNHVSSIIKKCYVPLKLIYQNINILNFKVRKKLCETLVMSIVKYGLIVYYSCLDVYNKNRVQRIQNYCCRLIYNLRKYDHVSRNIYELLWLKISFLYNFTLANMIYSITSTSTPPYLKEKLIPRNSLHSVDLRNTAHFSMARFRSAMFQRSFSFNSVHVYNDIPQWIKDQKNKVRFKSELHAYYLAISNNL